MRKCCTSNQKQIAIAIQIYTQENDEKLPNSATVWSSLSLAGKVLVCPTAGKKLTNGYGYNRWLDGMVLGEIVDPTITLLTADGSVGSNNVIVTQSNIDKRHSGGAIYGFVDGHVAYSTTPVSLNSLLSDLTPSATLTSCGNWSGYPAENLRSSNLWGSYWMSNATYPAWAKYSWASPQYIAYALLGGNGDRIPDGIMTVQYSVNDDGTWVDAAVVPVGGNTRLCYIPVGKTVRAARVLLAHTTTVPYVALYAFRVFGSDTPPIGTLNMTPNIMATASVTLTNTWEGVPANIVTAWSDQLADGDSPRANGNLSSKPQAILSWPTNQTISGLAIANKPWYYSGGSIYAMTIEACAQGVDPATPGAAWSTVFTYSDTSAAPKLINGIFTDGTVSTRGLRLTITSVQDTQNNTPRAGGGITEIAVLGGFNP